MYPVDWSRRLRFLYDLLDDIADPIDRLGAVEEVRGELREILTSVIERACWDARATDRDAEAVPLVGSRKAFVAYSRRYNGRLDGAQRVRWNDPLTPYRRQHARDIREVSQHQRPGQVHPARAEGDPHLPEKR